MKNLLIGGMRITIMLALCTLIFVVPAVAAAPGQNSRSTPDSAQPIDVVVLLDDSGSMATCWPWPQDGPPFRPPCGAPSYNLPSDPDELRYSAARLLLQLADQADRVAVLRFDSQADGIGNLGSLQTIGDDENRRRLIESLQPPTNYAQRGYTRIDLGLQEAIELLEAAKEPGRDQYVLLLTDGEPSQPGGVGDQQARIAEQLETLTANGTLTFPVVLCNPTAGCADHFLSEQFPEYGILEAAGAQDLLSVFAELFADMKPDRSIQPAASGSGNLAFTTRAPHGVRQLALITPRDDLLSVQRDGEPIVPRNTLSDPNIAVHVIEGEELVPGAWTSEARTPGGFAVVQADSYPYLLNPPPSLANSPASTRYYPAGRPPLILAQGIGPGAGETLLYDGQSPLLPIGDNAVRGLILDENPTEIRLQLGEDSQPLQLERTFRLEKRDDLPRMQIFSPRPGAPGLKEDGHLTLTAGFGGGSDVLATAASVYIKDRSPDAPADGQLVYQADLRCIAQLCSDDNFQPEDGRSYEVTFVLQGQKDGIRFGDWEQTDLEMAPAVYLRGLPGELDLAQMPVEGWPIELTAGTTEEIGTISAKIRLSDTQSGEIVADVGVEFMEDVPESGSLTTTLLINGLTTLRPGSYSGELTLEAADPAGRPIDVRIRPGAELPVTLTVPRPLAHIDSQLADFGSILFNTSPNFRLDQELLIPIRFDGSPFAVSAQIRDSNCQDLSVVSGELRERAGQQFLPLRLTSPGPVTAGSCAGELILSGPDPDHDVLPGQIGWQMNVDNLEWSLVNGDLALGDLQNAGERTEGVLLIRYNGETPFVMEVRDIRAAARDETRSITLDAESLDIPPIEVTGEPNEAGLYEVPVAFVARQSVPTDQQQGLFYSGALALGLVGLADNEQMIAFSFRSPSFIQRYVAPIVVPVYSMPWAICTWPFTLLFFLVLIARIRGRNVDEEAIEEAAAAAAMHMTSQADIESDAARWAPEQSLDIRNSEAGPTWDNAEWGSVWAGNGAQDRGPDSDSGPAQEKRDPWTSNW